LESNMHNSLYWIAASIPFLLGPCAYAACPDGAAIDAYVADFKMARPSKGFGADLSLADAECARNKLTQALPEVLGNVVGYKAGFTGKALQERFKVPAPAYGVMFSKYMVSSGAKLPAKFGARPLFEADLVAVVKDAELANAKTPLEALEHISEVAPFIELPDLALEGKPLGNAIISTNIAFRGGALGPRIKVEATPEFLDSLANMMVVMTEDRQGKELGRVKGDALMGNPINAAMWLAQALKKDGITLKPGDLLSLGGYIPPSPTKEGTTITVKYLGLPGDPSVTTHFD
jgi:2-keto-4-pentenoate hydratase